MKNITVLILTIFVIILFSCKKEEEKPSNMGHNFFPLELGEYKIYKVDSIVWNDYNNTIDTFKYQVKIVIDSMFYDNANRKSYKWKKYDKKDSLKWTYRKTYAYTKLFESVESVEEDQRITKLVFPISAGSSWDCNAKNSNPEQYSYYSDVDFTETILNKTYDSCATVIYQEDINMIEEFVHLETYARDFGMIYKKRIFKETGIAGIKGYYLEYKLIENGKN